MKTQTLERRTVPKGHVECESKCMSAEECPRRYMIPQSLVAYAGGPHAVCQQMYEKWLATED